MADFYNFEAGQQVARIFHHWDRHIEALATVDRVTANLAIVHGLKFDRKTGREYGNRYSSRKIEPVTKEILAELATQEHRRTRHYFLVPFLDSWTKMSEENLDKVAAVLGFAGQQGESRGK